MKKMGSLPNLHELGKEESSRTCSSLSQPHSYPLQNSLTNEEKNKILHRHSTHCKNKTRNYNGQNKIICDDFTLEHMAAYSPISSRSTRNLTHNIRRRDSLNSSIGATSVRRLIAVVRNTNSKYGPVYSRKILIRNLIILSISHFLITTGFLPFLALQGSVSVWNLPLKYTIIITNINVGPLLLTLLYFLASVSILFGPSLVQKLGTNLTFLLSYGIFALFYGLHLYPTLYILIPIYILLGLTLGPLSIARINFLMTISSKLSYVFSEEDEDTKNLRRTTVIRRVARTFQAAQDFGFIFGSILSAVLITFTINFTNNNINNNTLNYTNNTNSGALSNSFNNKSTFFNFPNNTQQLLNNNNYDYNAYLDEIFDIDEFGDRLCGSQACPSSFLLNFNVSDENYYHVLPKTTAAILTSVYLGVSLIALIVSGIGLDKIRMYVQQDPLERSEGLAALRAVKESFKDAKLQLAAPLAVFIGMEQAFMYADFSKSYVVCTLGIHRLNLVFLCMGLLQSIAACTLSMLLKTIRRYYVIAVGFAFHACLLMVQMLWKPMGDDPALFYVISAAWGVCNAIWEMLNFTLLTGLYADNWEAPFANSLSFRHIGMAMAFLLHGLLCNWIKLYLLAFLMLFAVIPFTWLEIRLENIRKVKNISRL